MAKTFKVDADVMLYPSFSVKAETKEEAKQEAEKILDAIFSQAGINIEHIEVSEQ